jgi:hypothetical protein
MLTEQELNAAFSTFRNMLGGGKVAIVAVVMDEDADGSEFVHTMSNMPSVQDRLEVLQNAMSCVVDADYQSVSPIIQPH